MIILGIDPGLAIVGFGIIEKSRRGIRVIDYGVITTDKSMRLPERLSAIYDSLKALISKYNPDCVAMEEIFFNTNITTGIAVSEARGVLLLCAKQMGCALYEYTPLQIKQALTGYGRADKHQVQFMVKTILQLSSIPKPDDAADALAVACTHAQTNTLLSGTDIK